MVTGWSRTLVHMYRVGRKKNSEMSSYIYCFSCRRISRVCSVEVPIVLDSIRKSYAATSEGQGLEQLVYLNKMFRSKPVSLVLPPGSHQRINEPNYKANVIYRRVVSQVENPVIYDVFRLEKTFRTTFSMLIVHMWLCLRRLKVEGKEGVELGQYVYEIFNHDLEIRVSKAGVNLLLSKWMRELEKIFYGNIVVYDTAMLPEAKPDELQNAIWKNVFSNDGAPTFDAAALPAILAYSRYVRRECSCLLLTDKESMFAGNFMFTNIENSNTPT